MFFRCSAWIHEDSIWPYLDFKSRFLLTTRIPKGFKEAVESIEDCVKNLPKQVRTCRFFIWCQLTGGENSRAHNKRCKLISNKK